MKAIKIEEPTVCPFCGAPIVRLLEDGVKEIYVDFGKWKGTSIDKVDKSYFKWMMENETFPVDTRHYAKLIYDRK